MSSKPIAPRINGHKTFKQNHRVIDLERTDFRNLSKLVGEAIYAAASYQPEVEEPQVLRTRYNTLYNFVCKYAMIGFAREFEPRHMSALTIDSVDLVNGITAVSFTHSLFQTSSRFRLTFQNHLAPYSTHWPNLLAKHGGNGDRAKELFTLV